LGRCDPERVHVRHSSGAATDNDVVRKRSLSRSESEIALANADRPARPAAEARPLASDDDARLIVDFDIADDLAAVRYGADRSARAGAIDRVGCRPWSSAGAARAARDFTAVGQRRNRPGIRYAGAARAANIGAAAAVSAADRAAMGVR
jgi:hypothetical protein